MGATGMFDQYADSGPGSMTLCFLIDGATLLTLGLNGATASVVIITLDNGNTGRSSTLFITASTTVVGCSTSGCFCRG